MQIDLVSRLKRLYRSASLDHMQRGLQWYFIANAEAHRLAAKYNRPLYQVVGVIAALSPNNAWERNLYDADLFLANPSIDTKVCTFKANRLKALAILETDEPDMIPVILNGRKTRSFYENMLRPETSEAVTVDLWMYRIAETKQGVKAYQAISDATLAAARELNVQPHQLQAVAWTVVRGY